MSDDVRKIHPNAVFEQTVSTASITKGQWAHVIKVIHIRRQYRQDTGRD
jgi:hypothetical protein